jgi:hypothetical protein
MKVCLEKAKADGVSAIEKHAAIARKLGELCAVEANAQVRLYMQPLQTCTSMLHSSTCWSMEGHTGLPAGTDHEHTTAFNTRIKCGCGLLEKESFCRETVRTELSSGCLQKLQDLIEGALKEECKEVEETLLAAHLHGGAWEPPVKVPKRGCRRELSDNTTAGWACCSDATANFASHEQVEHGYSVFAAAARCPGGLQIGTESTEAAVQDMISGGKLPKVSQLVSDVVAEHIGNSVDLFVVRNIVCFACHCALL